VATGPFGGVEERFDQLRVSRKGLLAKDMLARLESARRPLHVERVGERDIDRVQRRIGEQLLVGPVGPRDALLPGIRLGAGEVAAGDCCDLDLVRSGRSREDMPVDVRR
jgi:hypothetical protein